MGISRGIRRKSRSALTKRVREKGKLGLSRLLVNYEIGQKVIIKIDSAINGGMPHKRFQGKVGTVVEKRGKSYILELPQRKTSKFVIAGPEHIMAQKGN
ncbi:50S ribosomal protein L21e [Candidatus Bathyarchaeota archaeon]|nr:50S ribosomal protein L21e [Candidatus Bathyarchaeota archaeon]